MRSLATICLLLLPHAALAGPIVTDTFSTLATTSSGARAFKLNTYTPSTDVRLVDFAPWLDPGGDTAELRFTVYGYSGSSVAGEHWELLYASTDRTISAGPGFKPSPVIDIDLDAGRAYALGVYFLGDSVEYAFDDDPAHEIVDWGRQDGLLFSLNYNAFTLWNPIIQSRSSGGYHQQVTVEIYQDLDGDGYDERYDCDDTDPTVHPSAPEQCNGIDNDCDGIIDNDVVYFDYWLDADGDGYGDPEQVQSSCDGPPPGYVSNPDDCDDTDPYTYPGAPEQCDGKDNDCDGVIDNDVVYQTWYLDADGDGYGVEDEVEETCDGPPPGYVDNADDCDDTDPETYPGAPEKCDGKDNDCDGVIDNDVVFTDWYADRDQDGFGDPDDVLSTCDGPPAGYVDNPDDCDDGNASVYPGAPERCDGLDNNCDGVIPDDQVDSDGDGWLDCEDCAPHDPTIYPGAEELCDGVDRNCDGVASTPESCDPYGSENLQARCGCRVSPGPAGVAGWLTVMLVLGLVRRGNAREHRTPWSGRSV